MQFIPTYIFDSFSLQIDRLKKNSKYLVEIRKKYLDINKNKTSPYNVFNPSSEEDNVKN